METDSEYTDSLKIFLCKVFDKKEASEIEASLVCVFRNYILSQRQSLTGYSAGSDDYTSHKQRSVYNQSLQLPPRELCHHHRYGHSRLLYTSLEHLSDEDLSHHTDRPVRGSKRRQS